MTPMLVLVVHENAATLDLVGAMLSNEGYECRMASNGRAALEVIDLRRPDTVLLSLDLPQGSGIELCRRIRRQTRTPVIAMSADHSETRKVNALDAGADDYLTVPFSAPELLARVRVALRHRGELASTVDDSVIRIGTLRLDPTAHAVAVDNRILPLTPKEFQLLVLLARHVNRVVTHHAILDAIWPNSRSLDTLRLHISQLRKKIGHAVGAPNLVTEPGVGYMLAAAGTTAEP
jgi:two-component system KDP operon response regulator KdpE